MKSINVKFLIVLAICFLASSITVKAVNWLKSVENGTSSSINGTNNFRVIQDNNVKGDLYFTHRHDVSDGVIIEIYINKGATAEWYRESGYTIFSWQINRSVTGIGFWRGTDRGETVTPITENPTKDSRSDCGRFVNQDVATEDYMEIEQRCLWGIDGFGGSYRYPTYYRLYTKRFGHQIQYIVDGNVYETSSANWVYSPTSTLSLSTSGTPSSSHNGYTFKGWNTSAETWAYDPATVSSASFTNENCWLTDKDNVKTTKVYAQWNAIIYNITFDSNGGSTVSPTDAQKHYNIETGSPELPTPTRPGYTFKGWKLKSNSGNWSTSTDSSAFTKIAEKNGKYGNIELIAVWEENTYWLKGEVNGTATNNSQTNIKYLSNSTAEMVFTPAKNFMLSGVKVTVDLDGTVTTPVDETFSPLKDSYTYPVSQVKGNTTVSVSTSRVSADVTIKRTGLQGNDSSIIKVTKQGESTALYTVILNAAVSQVTLDQVPVGTYTITETNWAYTYNKTTASQTLTIAATDANDPTVMFAGDKKSINIFSTETHN